MKFDDGREIAFKESPKLDVLSELLQEITVNSKVIVWCCFKNNYTAITELCNKLELKSVLITGEQSHKEKEDNITNFRTDKDIKVVIANPAAAGTGVNLVEAPYAIFYSRDFSLEKYLQAQARNYRGGSEIHKNITLIDIVVEDTIDMYGYKVLASKEEMGESILNYIRGE